MSRDSTFSLTIMVIIMALLAVFIGYLLGNWLIQMVTGDVDNSQQVSQDKIVQEETIKDSSQNIDNQNISMGNRSSENNNDDSNNNNNDSNNTEDIVTNQIKGTVYTVQVGAFNNYNNAASLKEELEARGFNVIISDESPYKVQLGATTDRGEAEKTEKEVETMGYNAFITH